MTKFKEFYDAFNKINPSMLGDEPNNWIVENISVQREQRILDVFINLKDNTVPTNDILHRVALVITQIYQLNNTHLHHNIPNSYGIPKEEPHDIPPNTQMPPQQAAFHPQANAQPVPIHQLMAMQQQQVQAKEETQFEKMERIRNEALAENRAKQEEERAAKGLSTSKLIFGKAIKKAPILLSELDLNLGSIVVEGDVFFVEHRELPKRRAVIISFDITDYTNSVRVNKFLNETEAAPILKGVKTGMRVRVQGRPNLDRFYNDIVLDPDSIVTIEKEMRQDNATEKRVELHLHTNHSTMDALASVNPRDNPHRNIVKRAEAWGHPAIAMTDHANVHAFPLAWHSAKNIKILYGVEAYFRNNLDDQVVVDGTCSTGLHDEIVCFDIETTGLNPKKEVLTEIGAVVLRHGEMTEEFLTFVQPGKMLSPEIVNLTGISDAMLVDAPSQEEALRSFIEFIGDRPLAAHNATFDVAFISEGCKKYNIPFENPSIDTLTLSQNMLEIQTKYKLDHVANTLNLPNFNHHRALDDAKVVAGILQKLWKPVEELGVTSLSQLNEKMIEKRQYFRNNQKGKSRNNHLIILAKSQLGIRNLYKLISFSHLNHFKRYPIMPKALIEEHREGLILGSACEAGELFAAIMGKKSWSELIRIASWYDYLEIQPICNNFFMIRKGLVDNEEDLRDLNRLIVKLGKELGKPVCATGDVHFLDPEDEIYRHILLASKQYDDADSSLPIYFKTTEEMLEEFSYLGEDTAFEVVVTNTNLVASWCEEVVPLPKGLFPPMLENSAEELNDLVWGKVKELYGDNPPQLVLDRVNVELGDIINCKYDVIYMASQKLVQDSLEHGYLVGSRGSVGSSIVAFMSGITEVNALAAHYRCPNCKHSDFDYGKENNFGCGADMPDQNCPMCGTQYAKDGFSIPFETFLGFGGDKVPDIDLNFSGEYQAEAHKYTFELFGEEHVFRAGTMTTVASKTAYGYVKQYLNEHGKSASKAEENRLSVGCTGVKKSTGQHPGGMVVIPQNMEIYDFCPVQRPADDTESDIITTHFEYHAMEENLLKLDILGHDDPSMIRMMQDITGVDPQTIPLDDPDTMSLFQTSKALGFENDPTLGPTGAVAIPEFGTPFVRNMLEDTKPDQFDILVRLSGFSHGTDVWLGNAKDLITSGTATVQQAIGCRDDIMNYLISLNMDEKFAFKIMEAVRKGKGLPDGAEDEMKNLGVPEWYIDSCKKIAYLFPKAHAVAYVMMAFRIAWYKVHRPLAFYAAYFSIRAKQFDEVFMCRGIEVCRNKMQLIKAREESKEASNAELTMFTTLEVCYEFYTRGFTFHKLDLYKSDSKNFLVDETINGLIPPFITVGGLGEAAAETLVSGRIGKEFISIEEVATACPKVSKTHIELLTAAGAFGTMPSTSQISFF